MPPRLTILASALLPLQNRFEALDQIVPAEGLGQEAGGSGLQDPCAKRIVRESRNENERRAVALSEQPTLKLHATKARHLYVGDDT
jgi:hypothetical protein